MSEPFLHQNEIKLLAPFPPRPGHAPDLCKSHVTMEPQRSHIGTAHTANDLGNAAISCRNAQRRKQRAPGPTPLRRGRQSNRIFRHMCVARTTPKRKEPRIATNSTVLCTNKKRHRPCDIRSDLRLGLFHRGKGDRRLRNDPVHNLANRTRVILTRSPHNHAQRPEFSRKFARACLTAQRGSAARYLRRPSGYLSPVQRSPSRRYHTRTDSLAVE